jgi:hypothetical protein
MSSRPRLDRLSAEDERILALERGSVAGHVCKVLIVDPKHHLARPSLHGRWHDHIAHRRRAVVGGRRASELAPALFMT